MRERGLRTERDGAVVRPTLDRPEVGNAIDGDLADALVDAAIACDTDATVRCVVLTGAGRMFCAGGGTEAREGIDAFRARRKPDFRHHTED